MSEYCGMEFWINITITYSKYDISYKNMSTGDTISFHITADNFTDLTEKIRVYLKDIADTNQLFAAHVEQLSRNEFIDYSKA